MVLLSQTLHWIYLLEYWNSIYSTDAFNPARVGIRKKQKMKEFFICNSKEIGIIKYATESIYTRRESI